jgi:hypothetical protein
VKSVFHGACNTTPIAKDAGRLIRLPQSWGGSDFNMIAL